MAELGESLSDRELDVVRCLWSGATNKEIAAELSISENTVKVHLRNIYTKLGVSSRTEATTAALQQGYIDVPGVEVDAADQPNQVTPSSNGAAASDEPEDDPASDAETAVAPARQRRNWRTPALIGLLLVSLVAIVLLGVQVMNQNAGRAAAPAAPFEEVALGDTQWFVSRPLPTGRANMAVATVGLDVYQLGGETAAGVDGAVNVFDSTEHLWRSAATKPTAVADVTAAELYGEIYVPGGRLPDGEPTSTVEAYSPLQNAWRPIAALPRPLMGGLALSDGAFLYVFGGWNGEQALDTAYVYDPGANSWRPLPPMPQARTYAAGGLLTNRLYVVGGSDGEEALASCHLFDPLTESWSECPEMLQPRTAAGATVLLNKLYVIGGMNGAGGISYSEVYDPTSETWQVVNTPVFEEVDQWPSVGVTHVETRIYALGGMNGDEFLEENLVYAPLVYQTFIPAASSNNGEE